MEEVKRTVWKDAPGSWHPFAFLNSARPIAVCTSQGQADRPNRAVWSRDGARLAFMAGAKAYVGEPTP